MGLTDGPAVYSPVFERGSIQSPTKETVPHQFLASLTSNSEGFTQEGSGRLQWANEIADQNNPLTARVMVNRIWHHIFGRGIVSSVDNFGIQGAFPTHPELLDYLALVFMDNGWSLKYLIKQILLSETFQRSTASNPENDHIDPENAYLHKYPIRRLTAESIRDGILKVSGNFDTTMFGPPVPIHLSEFMTGRGRPGISGPLDGAGRRSVYIAVRRNFLDPFLLAFDLPIPFSTFGKRNVTTVPNQSLTLMNSPLVHSQARFWAERIIKEHPDIDQRISLLYLEAYARAPATDELEDAKQILSELANSHELPSTQIKDNLMIWSDFCHILINAKEFIYLL